MPVVIDNGYEEVCMIFQGFLYNIIENDIMTYNESRKVMSIMDQVRKIIGVKYPFE